MMLLGLKTADPPQLFTSNCIEKVRFSGNVNSYTAPGFQVVSFPLAFSETTIQVLFLISFRSGKQADSSMPITTTIVILKAFFICRLFVRQDT
jgi:hypothetical protein